MANNFSGDSNCKALWRFEPGALTTDSKGGNTLTASASPASDAADYKEGAGCVDYESTEYDYHYRNDADLDAGFPLKSGDTNKKISVCLWLKIESAPGAGVAICSFSKYTPTTNERTFGVANNDTNQFGFLLGYNNGDSYEQIWLTTALTTGRWYHAGITYQDSDKSYRIRVWDSVTEALHEEKTGNTTNNIYIGAEPIRIGAREAGYFDGKIDEVVVFNDILSSAEIDQIRAGTYGAATAALTGTATASITEADIV